MKRYVWIVLFFALFATTSASGANEKSCDADLPEADIRSTVDILAHQALGGRGTEQPGFDVAGLILARELRNTGFAPLWNIGGYFQQFAFTTSRGAVHTSRNVIGYLPGTTTGEYVIIGAHYDHEGIWNGITYPGADDNASGTAGVLAIARKLGECVSSGRKLRRGVIIGFWGAEEWGLHGSAHFAHSGIMNLNHIVAVLNLDMIGRNAPQELVAIGTEHPEEFPQRSPALEMLLQEENAKLEDPFNIKYPADYAGHFSATDSYSFYEASAPDHRIPTLFLTTGLHADYHAPSDTAEKIDVHKLSDIARLTYRIALRLATSSLRPVYFSQTPVQP